jgi:hypothetical protein
MANAASVESKRHFIKEIPPEDDIQREHSRLSQIYASEYGNNIQANLVSK